MNVAGHPAAIDETEIEALKRIVESPANIEPWQYLQVGELVRIETGALAGIEGILESTRGGRRIVLSVTLLQRSVAVELDRESVCPLRGTTSIQQRAARGEHGYGHRNSAAVERVHDFFAGDEHQL